MMKRIVHNIDATVRDIVPWLAFLMGAMLFVAFASMAWFVTINGLLFVSPTGQMIRGIFAVSIVVFGLVGTYWKKLWSFILSMRAERLARRDDYFEITAKEWVVLSSQEWSGEIIDFKGLNRSFVHFDNEQDRIIFRLQR